MNQQKGSGHTVLIIAIIAALIAALGFVFWQNYMSEEEEVATSTTTSEMTEDTPEVDMIEENKSGIRASMAQPNYEGLEAYMTETVDGGLAFSDGIFNDIAAAEMVNNVHGYFNGPDDAYTWEFSDFEDVTHEGLLSLAEENTFFDFTGSYVVVGESSNPDRSDGFIAYRMNEDGLIINVFYGLIL